MMCLFSLGAQRKVSRLSGENVVGVARSVYFTRYGNHEK